MIWLTKYLKKTLAVPVGMLSIALMILDAPICAIWVFCLTMTKKAGSGLPEDMTRLRLPHWYLGRITQHLWSGRPLWRR